MADLTKMAASEIVEEHKTEAHAPYLLVWGALAILTAVEYVYAGWFKELFLILLLGLLVLAVVKAGLVGWFFMHLKFEGNWVYIMIVPAFVLATIFVLALMPDMVLKQNADEPPPADESSFVVPAPGRPGPAPRTGRRWSEEKLALNGQDGRGWLHVFLLRMPVAFSPAAKPSKSPPPLWVRVRVGGLSRAMKAHQNRDERSGGGKAKISSPLGWRGGGLEHPAV